MVSEKLKILLVDDDEDDYILTRELVSEIERWTVDIDWAPTYAKAMTTISSVQHDVYLVDYRLGDHDGIEFLSDALEHGCKAPIIFLTGQGDYGVDLEAMEAGAADYLIKAQIDANLLERSIRYSLQRKQAQEKQASLEEDLRTANQELEAKVNERTSELGASNELLQKEIAERELLEEQFLQAQKMEAIGQLAGGVAHDFNNLLTPILAYTQMALKDSSLGDTLRRRLHEIDKAAERAAVLTRQLLTFSRREIVEPKIINLNELIINMKSMLQRVIGEDIDLITLPSPVIWPVKVDPGQMEQILMNMAVNARDAMPDGGTIKVETYNAVLGQESDELGEDSIRGPHVIMEISDTGTGIPDDVKKHIFEPFFTTKDVDKGTGLGLSTCFGIVKQSEGHIYVDSELGSGTTFKILLPRADEITDSRRQSISAVYDQKGTETVLLAEDDSSVRAAISSMLSDQGYNVLEAANGVEALRVAEEADGRIHLLLTDVVMPVMGGRDLADQIRILYPDTRVLFASGYTGDDVIRHGILESETDFVQKPLTPTTLFGKVREVLDR